MASWLELWHGCIARADRPENNRGLNVEAASRHRLQAGSYLLVLACLGSLRAEPTFYQARVAPILDQNCVVCHGEKKHKAGLRLDSYEAALKGGDDGAVIIPGDLKKSELLRRIKLPSTDEDAMPSDGKPSLSANEIKILELWIEAGASSTKLLGDFSGVPLPEAKVQIVPLTPDWHPRAADIAAFEQTTGVYLRPRSQIPTDGLVLRTASAPSRCNDAALAKLGPLAEFVVEAELARTKITDAGLAAIGACKNLRELDLTHTAVTSDGLKALTPLGKLESLNLTATAVDDAGLATVKTLPALKHVWTFGSKVSAAAASTGVAVK